MPQPNSASTPSTYASIMVPMDLDPHTRRRAELAADLADRFSSRLIGVAAEPIVAPLYFEAVADGVASIIEIEERRAREEIASAEAEFRRVAGNRGPIEWRQSLSDPLDHALKHARAADLIVTARPWLDQRQLGPMSVSGADLVMDAGRPVLFAPADVGHLSAKRIVVGWKDSRETRRAVWDALPFLHAALEVLVVSVGGDLEAATDVAGYLTRHGINASALNRPGTSASPGDELIRIATQEACDLIVCGAYGHSRAREWVFGGVTQDLLEHSPLCCLMAH